MKAKKKVVVKSSAKLGKAVDALYVAHLKVSQEQAKVNRLKEKYDAQEAKLWAQMDKEKTLSVKGSCGLAYVSETVVPSVVDFDKALVWIVKHKAWDMLTRKIKSDSWRERLAASKKPIPGISSFTNRSFHCKKAG